MCKWDDTVPIEQVCKEWAMLVMNDIEARVEAGAKLEDVKSDIMAELTAFIQEEDRT